MSGREPCGVFRAKKNLPGWGCAGLRQSDAARCGAREINEIAYEDDRITVVHVEHFASQGDLIPQWLGEGEYGRSALRAVTYAVERFA